MTARHFGLSTSYSHTPAHNTFLREQSRRMQVADWDRPPRPRRWFFLLVFAAAVLLPAFYGFLWAVGQ